MEIRTGDEALHLVLAHDVDAERIPDLFVELVRSAAGGHDGELTGPGAIESQLVVAQMLHELDAVVYPFGLEALEVEATTRFLGVDLAREVDEFGKRASDLQEVD
jgi:hypothetical protein